MLKWIDVGNHHQQSIRPSLDSIHHGRPQKMKSLAVIAYNNEKTGIDKSDQIIATTYGKSSSGIANYIFF